MKKYIFAVLLSSHLAAFPPLEDVKHYFKYVFVGTSSAASVFMIPDYLQLRQTDATEINAQIGLGSMIAQALSLIFLVGTLTHSIDSPPATGMAITLILTIASQIAGLYMDFDLFKNWSTLETQINDNDSKQTILACSITNAVLHFLPYIGAGVYAIGYLSGKFRPSNEWAP